MRRARIKVSADAGAAVYHLLSRTVNGEWMLGPAEKEILRRQIWQVADFAGLEVITYAVLSNHFHILVRVPRRKPITDEELLRRYRVLYPEPTPYQTARLQVIAAQLSKNGAAASAWRTRQLSLMNDISAFMKLVKERFSIWYNRRHSRFGPVWSDRFKSVLVEPNKVTLQTIAAYIDLNSVRAGIVNDPKDYRYCGYAEAVAGREEAQRGLASGIGSPWAVARETYRLALFTRGAESRNGRAQISSVALGEVVRSGGKLTLPEILRCRIRYFSEGAVLGGRAFVEAHVSEYRRRFGCGERVQARPLAALGEWHELLGLRPIRGSLLG